MSFLPTLHVEDTIIRMCKPKKNRQDNGQKEKDKHNLQNTTHKTYAVLQNKFQPEITSQIFKG